MAWNYEMKKGGLYRIVTNSGDKIVGEYGFRYGDEINSMHNFKAILSVGIIGDPLDIIRPEEVTLFKRDYRASWRAKRAMDFRDDGIESLMPIDPNFADWVDCDE